MLSIKKEFSVCNHANASLKVSRTRETSRILLVLPATTSVRRIWLVTPFNYPMIYTVQSKAITLLTPRRFFPVKLGVAR